MKGNRIRCDGSERGQVLVLFSLLSVIVLLFVMLVVDVGFLMIEKQKLQNALDAAALAGAQELPDDAVLAEQMARDYADANGLDPDALAITFSCTSNFIQVCNPAQGKYDTIQIDAKSRAPAFFGGVLGMVGDAGCWKAGCQVGAEAAACSGACDVTGGKVDVVAVIDHTGSMSNTDLQNAKDGALELYRTFDYQVHNLALVVTPPVHPADPCDTIETWADVKTWIPIRLTNNYQTAPNVLNTFSPLVLETNCLDRATGGSDVPGPHTNLGDPMREATNELLTSGRPGAKLGIVFETDGAANIMDPVAAAAVGATGPCDYAMKMATAAKGAGIEVYTIAYGADDSCTYDAVGTYWRNRPATELLSAMATDAAHYYYEPKTSDLNPIFQEIAILLSGKTKLIK